MSKVSVGRRLRFRSRAFFFCVGLTLGCGFAIWKFGLPPADDHSPSNTKFNSSASNDVSSTGFDTPETLLPSLPDSALLSRDDELKVGLDPESVGWPSEAFSDATLKRLKSLPKIGRELATDEAKVSDLLTDDFSCSQLRPTDLKVVFRDTTITVARWPIRADVALGFDRTELVEQLRRLPGIASKAREFAFKNIRIQLDESPRTRVRVAGFGIDSGAPTEWTATWECRWKAVPNVAPKLKSIRLLDYEEIKSTSQSRFLIDRTSSVLNQAAGYSDQLQVGMNTWVNRLERRLRVNRLGHNGIAVGDVNGDGRDDVYVCQPGGLPNRLYIQQSDGTVLDTSSVANVDFLDDTTCALIVDLDNDGDQDLALVTVAAAILLSNNGTGVFSPKAVIESCRNSFSLTAADIDQDRLLDLYVGRYWATDVSRGEHPLPIPYYDANNGGRNVMLRNRGDWKFDDVTAEVGLDQNNSRFTMAAAWEDLDSDGDVDLYVANDFGRNSWYRNQNGIFEDVASEAEIEDIASGMSVSFSDFNHDRHPDIYVSNMFSTAGQRTTTQAQYKKSFSSNQLSKLQRLARGNTLFRNNSGNRFTDVSVDANVTMGRWAWGSLFADINNDSWDDLLVCNGFLTSSNTGDL